MKLNNVRRYYKGASTKAICMEEEVDLMISILEGVIGGFPNYATRGTLEIDAVRAGRGQMNPILRVDFEDGRALWHDAIFLREISTVAAVREALKDVMSRRRWLEVRPSKIDFMRTQPCTMILQVAGGTVLAGVEAESVDRDQELPRILLAIAEMLGHMYPGDGILYENKIKVGASTAIDEQIMTVKQEVTAQFEQEPMIAEVERWQKAVRRVGKTSLFE